MVLDENGRPYTDTDGVAVRIKTNREASYVASWAIRKNTVKSKLKNSSIIQIQEEFGLKNPEKFKITMKDGKLNYERISGTAKNQLEEVQLLKSDRRNNSSRYIVTRRPSSLDEACGLC